MSPLTQPDCHPLPAIPPVPPPLAGTVHLNYSLSPIIASQGKLFCWQSGRINRLWVQGVGSRKGQVGPVRQQEPYGGGGGDAHTSVGSQAGSRVIDVGSRKGQVGPVRQQELYRGRGGDDCKEGVAVRPDQSLNGLIVLGSECKDDIWNCL